MSRHHHFNEELNDFLTERNDFEDLSEEDLEKLTWTSIKVKERLKNVSHVKQKDIHYALIRNHFDVDKACLWIMRSNFAFFIYFNIDLEQKHTNDSLKLSKKSTFKKGLISLNDISLNKDVPKASSDSKISIREGSFENKESSITKQSKLLALANSRQKLSSNNSTTVSPLKSVLLLSRLTKTKFNITDNTESNENHSSETKLDESKNLVDYNIESEEQNILKTTALNRAFQDKEIIEQSLNNFFKKNYEYIIELKPSKFALSIFGGKLIVPNHFYKFANQRFSLFTGILDDDLKSAFHETSNNSSKLHDKKEENFKTSIVIKPTIYSKTESDNNDLHHKFDVTNVSSKHENNNTFNNDESNILTKLQNVTSNLKITNDEKKKDNINIVIIGHVDAGKSTLIGRLLYDLKIVDIKTLEKLKHQTNKSGKSSFHFAWLLDQTLEERNRGITMDLSINYFETSLRKYTILDAPGHKDFVPNMIAGAAHADAAILVVDSSYGSFESGFMAHGQTREHVILVRSLGIQKMIVAINKLETINWAQERYEEIKAQLLQFFIYKGFQKSNILFIPCSGLTGENLTEITPLSSELKLWYSDFTLLNALENLSIEHRQRDAPFRLSIIDMYKSSNSSISIYGRVETGAIHVGKEVIIMPSKEIGTVKSIYVHDNPQNVAFSGDGILVNLSNVDLSPGDIMCDLENPVQVILKFRARIVTFDLSKPLIMGSPLVIHRGRLNVDANIKKLIAIIDKSTGQIKKKNPKFSFDAAIVEIEFCKQAEPMEAFKHCKELGRFIARFEGKTIAAGIIEDE
ncbi:hypothetical protein PCANB_002604 [Pneumocystis canis]|nr:hypothetical protein PCANB_002604 [Pneumocystis canis]